MTTFKTFQLQVFYLALFQCFTSCLEGYLMSHFDAATINGLFHTCLLALSRANSFAILGAVSACFLVGSQSRKKTAKRLMADLVPARKRRQIVVGAWEG